MLDVAGDEALDPRRLIDREVDGQIDEPADLGPGPVIEEQVVSLDDHEVGVGPDRDRPGDRLLEVPVEARCVDGLAVEIAQSTEQCDETGDIEGVGRALAVCGPCGVEHLLREVEAVHRHHARTIEAGDEIGGHGRLPGAGRTGEPDDPTATSDSELGDAGDESVEVHRRRTGSSVRGSHGCSSLADMSTDLLQDFRIEPFAHDGTTRDVLWKGDGPGLVIMTEMPGITPEVADFARRMVDAGFTVAMPDLFGERGHPASTIAYLRAIVPACVSRQWAAFARGRTAPVIDWLRALARRTHERCGGRGVGVLGMCWTGGFALGVAVDPSVRVPVLSQPSLPLGPRGKADLHLSSSDLAAVSERHEREELCAIGLRFTEDPLSPGQRFDSLRRELGDAFVGIEIDSCGGNEHGFGSKAHSVLTAEYRAEPGHPTYEAERLVIEHFDRQLRS